MNYLYDDISLDNSIALLEGYVGKDNILKKVEKLLDSVCSEIRSVNLDSLESKTKSYANDSRIKEVEKLLCRKFKAKDFKLYIYDDLITNTVFGTNGFTMPQTFGSLLMPSEDGMTTKLTIHVNIAQSMIYRCDLTGGELLGIIIHEVGHNVRRDWLRKIINVTSGVFSLPTSALIHLNVPQTLYMRIPREIDSQMPELYHNISKCVRIVKNLFNSINKYDNLLRNIQYFLSNPGKILEFISPIPYFNGYIEEKYADSLATSMGYGPDLARALHKMENLTHVLKLEHTPTTVSIVEDFIIRTMSLIIAPLDVHPDSAIRVVSQLKYMKRELNNPDIPKFKKDELIRELEVLEYYIEHEYLNPNTEYNKKIPFTYIWNVLVYKLNGFADIREICNLLALEA